MGATSSSSASSPFPSAKVYEASKLSSKKMQSFKAFDNGFKFSRKSSKVASCDGSEEDRPIEPEISYRSKLSVVKTILKAQKAKNDLFTYSETNNKDTVFQYYDLLDKAKTSNNMGNLRRAVAHILIQNPIPEDESERLNGVSLCLDPLRYIAIEKASKKDLIKAVNETQDLLLSQVFDDYESYIATDTHCTNDDSYVEVHSKQESRVSFFKAHKSFSEDSEARTELNMSIDQSFDISNDEIYGDMGFRLFPSVKY